MELLYGLLKVQGHFRSCSSPALHFNIISIDGCVVTMHLI